MSEEDGLICAYRINGDGTSVPLGWHELDAPAQDHEWTWLHFDVSGARTRDWLTHASGLDEHAVDALLAEETRPRATLGPFGTLLVLRGVNLYPEADPTDMVSIRLWVQSNRIISTRIRRLLSVQTIRQRCDAGKGPTSVGDFLIDLNNGLIERMSGVIQSLDEEIDELEDKEDGGLPVAIRPRLTAARQKVIPLRRHLSPQRDALSQLLSARVDWMEDWQRGQLRESADRLTRYIEELDAMRERAAVIQDTIATLLSERMNQHMLTLSIVAAIFLPLGLLTGLLGINVEGIPGAKHPLAFWFVVLLMLGLAGFEVWLFRKLNLIGRGSNMR